MGREKSGQSKSATRTKPAEEMTGRATLIGYYPGVVGRVIELHAVYYHENWAFDISFETQVGRELSEFMRDFQKGRDGFWAATVDGEFAGAVAIDGQLSETEGARLRWFIVDPSLQRRGIGNMLLREAVQFCKRSGHTKVYLWTFKGLDGARRLYETHGFILTEEHEVDQWGGIIKEQKFELILAQ